MAIVVELLGLEADQMGPLYPATYMFGKPFVWVGLAAPLAITVGNSLFCGAAPACNLSGNSFFPGAVVNTFTDRRCWIFTLL